MKNATSGTISTKQLSFPFGLTPDQVIKKKLAPKFKKYRKNFDSSKMMNDCVKLLKGYFTKYFFKYVFLSDSPEEQTPWSWNKIKLLIMTGEQGDLEFEEAKKEHCGKKCGHKRQNEIDNTKIRMVSFSCELCIRGNLYNWYYLKKSDLPVWWLKIEVNTIINEYLAEYQKLKEYFETYDDLFDVELWPD